MMSPHDTERLADFVDRFISRCDEIAPPFHLVCIASNGSVAVTLHTDSGVEEVCGKTIVPGFVTPLLLTIIGKDGSGRSTRIVASRRALGHRQRESAAGIAPSRQPVEHRARFADRQRPIIRFGIFFASFR